MTGQMQGAVLGGLIGGFFVGCCYGVMSTAFGASVPIAVLVGFLAWTVFFLRAIWEARP